MAKVLRVPSEKFRDKISKTLEEYMTTMTKELGTAPPRDVVVAEYVAACEAVLGRRLERGELRPDETAWAARLDERLGGDEWLLEGGGLRRPYVRIHEGVRVAEGSHKAPGGLIRCVAVVRDDVLEDIGFSGDFTARPATMPGELDTLLIGARLEEEELLSRVTDYYERVRPEVPGVAAGDWVKAVMTTMAVEVPA
jgi:lipoate-protein ligase A